ncbi:uncharacterized protein ACRADG_004583 isoform 2-T3 [Cochliomyia hominivorax]
MVVVFAKPLSDYATQDNGEIVSTLMALSDLINPEEVHYDQRQKGDENYRVKLDGFFIGFPQEDTSLLLLTEDLFESADDEDFLLGFGKNKPDSKSSIPSSITTPTILSGSTSATENLSPNSPILANNLPAMVVEIPAPKKYSEARHNVNTGSKTKSYIAQFLKLLKRGRKQ